MENRSIHRKQVKAVLKHVRISPTKIRRALQEISGKTYSEAQIILGFMPYDSCYPVIKLLNSALANAKNKFKFRVNETAWTVFLAFAQTGPTLKRIQPKAKGRAGQILKKTTHITIIIEN